jgi:hypothetical protein
VLAHLLEDQFAAKLVTREQFEEAFTGDTWRQAAAAFLHAVLIFSPRPKVLFSLFGTGTEIVARLNSTSSDGRTNSPDQPESTPVTLASAR